jgi:DNA-binding GntR family transcriptional regulator
MKIQSTNEQICNYLKEQIAEGTLKQGQQLNLNQIAEAFGVSITPVRDAVNIMIHAGFIDKTGNKMFIHKIPERERHMLEKALVLQFCAGYQLCLEMGLRDKLIKELEMIIERQATFIEIDSTQRREKIPFDTAFVRCTGNTFLTRNAERDYEYYDDLMYIGFQIQYEKQKIKSLKEHKEILALVKEGRDDEFYDMMTRHYQDVIVEE